MTKALEDTKKINTLVKQSLLQTKKTGKAGTKSGKNKGKKPAARGSKAKGKKGAKKKAGAAKAKAKANSGDSKEKEDSSKEKDKDENKSTTYESLTSCHPSNPGSCRCGASMDYTVSSRKAPCVRGWMSRMPSSMSP